MLDSVFQDVQDAWQSFRYGAPEYSFRDAHTECITIVGLPGSGKHTLYNSLMGWLSATSLGEAYHEGGLPVDDYGLFRIVSLAEDALSIDGVSFQLEDSAAIVYVIDGAAGLRPEDRQWITRLRSRRPALLVIVNKADCITDVEATQRELETQLARPVLPITATNACEVQTRFASALMQVCPQIMIPLATQVPSIRQEAASRVIRHAALLSLITSLEPVPLLDVSVETGIQIYMVNRLIALYRAESGSQVRWEVGMSVALGLVLRYAAQTLVKFVPYGGWLVSGLLGASGTWLVGRATITYLDAQAAQQPLPDHLAAQVRHALQRRSQQ